MDDEDVVTLDLPAARSVEEPKRPVTAPPERRRMSAALPASYVGGATVRKTILPLWTVRWTPDVLRSMYDRMSPREFDRGMRARPISADELLFKEVAIDRMLDRDTTMPELLDTKGLWIGMPRFCGVDLAIAEAEREQAYFAMAGIAVEGTVFYVIRLYRERGLGFAQQISAIKEEHRAFQYVTVVVESNAYQKALTRYMVEDEEEIIPVVPYYTTSESKVDSQLGLPGFAAEVEQGRWKIPYGDARSRRIAEPLLEEMRAYPTPGPTYDALMASFFAREGYRQAADAANRSRRPGIAVINF